MQVMMQRLFFRLFDFTCWLRKRPKWIQRLFCFIGLIILAPTLVIPNHFVRLAVFTPLWSLAGLYMVTWFGAEFLEWRREFIIRQTDTLDRIRTLHWRDFEALVGAIYVYLGYELEPRGGDQPDGGIDHILWKDGKRTLVQCKHWQDKYVGVSVVRELYGTLMADGAKNAIVVTSGGFTEEATAFVQEKPLELVDGPGLYHLLEKVRDAPEREPDLVKESLDRLLNQFVPDAGREIPQCPKCGAKMVPKRNTKDGSWFWGCSRYHASVCRGSRSLGPAEHKLIETIHDPGR